jgi:hypothetical protein
VRIKGKASFQPTVYISGIKVKDKEGLDNTVSRRVLNHRGEPLAIGEENLIRKIFSDLVSDKKLENQFIDIGNLIIFFCIKYMLICCSTHSTLAIIS